MHDDNGKSLLRPLPLPIQFPPTIEEKPPIHEISTVKRIFSMNTAQIIPLFT
jgi:hypothetical protein